MQFLKEFWHEITDDMTPFGKYTSGILIYVITLIILAVIFTIGFIGYPLRNPLTSIWKKLILLETKIHNIIYKKK